MNETHETILRRLRALAEEAPADIEQAVARVAFETAAAIRYEAGVIVAYLGGEEHRVAVALGLADGPAAVGEPAPAEAAEPEPVSADPQPAPEPAPEPATEQEPAQ